LLNPEAKKSKINLCQNERSKLKSEFKANQIFKLFKENKKSSEQKIFSQKAVFIAS
jgi:hypothetical protein